MDAVLFVLAQATPSFVDRVSDGSFAAVQFVAEKLGVNYGTLLVTLTTALLGAVSGVVGCFAVLRRRALVGDALAHAPTIW